MDIEFCCCFKFNNIGIHLSVWAARIAIDIFTLNKKKQRRHKNVNIVGFLFLKTLMNLLEWCAKSN